MDPVFMALLIKYGAEAVIGIVNSWKTSGEPTDDQIREAYITRKPSEYFEEKDGSC